MLIEKLLNSLSMWTLNNSILHSQNRTPFQFTELESYDQHSSTGNGHGLVGICTQQELLKALSPCFLPGSIVDTT